MTYPELSVSFDESNSMNAGLKLRDDRTNSTNTDALKKISSNRHTQITGERIA